MITIIYGGTSSGKSAYAEGLVCNSKYNYRYYLATMSSQDEESKARIKRHRKLRSGKRFITLEHPVDVKNAIGDIERIESGDFSTEDPYHKSNIVLLECMSNLLANEMFKGGVTQELDFCVNKILSDIQELEAKVSELVIVTNNIFDDGIAYEAETKDYIRALGAINSQLALRANKVVEVTVGIPIVIKG
ncbi:adenosylcobinamide kinase /adenosylcobinamide-phosphate guanylyltransferase [Pseudobutyrivibrio sp. YE44]|uniref:bifunctional adenosylcobinamide kinase/adenosylcobinamide-phosphate guanylyltransferase n=1 Tax=Pseudobutyrivibrio sp. YE44 TaxID=1520802 RepID=UPI00088E103A|nr:bifunctional adenosylcobinamide kinase/adenosylcobinamide-phosphate guanylyltransferase [Pseudobutyrivibrio sp. YE44]SDB05973.1 adenosylcobinamide kinase /adenosylcobinamide-phosphate guanylyltransferase [Pseudobutyrivibrio sp. YE44]